MVVKTSGRCERLETEGCSEKEDNHKFLERNRQKDSQLHFLLPGALPFKAKSRPKA